MSLLALIAPTWAISSFLETGLAMLLRCSTAASTAFSMPRRTAVELLPRATLRMPSLKIARASTVAVVVPSPARSLVLLATSLTSLAPMFSKRSSSSISLLTVTPSLVTVGPPKDLAMITLRPVGPIVTATALASFSTPLSILARAESSKSSCFATSYFPASELVIGLLTTEPRRSRRQKADYLFGLLRVSAPSWLYIFARLSEHFREDVGFAEDLDLVAVDFDVAAGVLAVDHLVADADGQLRARLPLSSSLPGPTAMTVPRCGFSLAVSGSTMPPAVFSSASIGSTTTRSSRGRSLSLPCVKFLSSEL